MAIQIHYQDIDTRQMPEWSGRVDSVRRLYLRCAECEVDLYVMYDLARPIVVPEMVTEINQVLATKDCPHTIVDLEPEWRGLHG